MLSAALMRASLVLGEPAEFRTEFFDVAAMPDRFGVLTPERADHLSMITLGVINAKRYQAASPKGCARRGHRGELQWWKSTEHEVIA
jgi:hypothetical protein